MRARRKEFSERDMAEIFVRDRATCCYSGKSLWLLDYGGGPSTADWVDHVRPASRGGSARLDNGVCSSWIFNKMRGTGARIPLFHHGMPNEDWFTLFEIVPWSIAEHLRRCSKLHWTDWYFNRAVLNVQIGAAKHIERRRGDGNAWSRGIDYHSRAAVRFLTQWREGIDAERPGSMKARGLIPSRPSPDQKLLLRLTDAERPADVRRIITALAPWGEASWAALIALAHVESKAEVRAHPFVTRRAKEAVATDVRRLWP